MRLEALDHTKLTPIQESRMEQKYAYKSHFNASYRPMYHPALLKPSKMALSSYRTPFVRGNDPCQ